MVKLEKFLRFSIGKPIIVFFLKCQHLFVVLFLCSVEALSASNIHNNSPFVMINIQFLERALHLFLSWN